MWFVNALLTFAAWGIADLFYKKGSNEEDKYSQFKIIFTVGLAMGIHAFVFMLVKGLPFVPLDLIKYLPVSAMYILSMFIGYVGLRYIELSISSPIQNSSGAVSAILLIIFCSYMPSAIEISGIAVICIGVLLLSIIEKRNADRERIKSGEITEKKYQLGFLAVIFPILYCIIDGLGTFADGLYLDEYEIMTEDAALIAYEFTFFICAMLAFMYVRFIKKQKFSVVKERDKFFAAIFETAGQFFYVYAIADNAVITAPIVASYCVLSVLLSRIFLKEKLSWKHYIAIFIVFAGILLLGISEGLAE